MVTPWAEEWLWIGMGFIAFGFYVFLRFIWLDGS